jgi:hypothetical protein
MTRVVHLQVRDLLWLAEQMEQHVWTIQRVGEVDDGPEFLNLERMIRRPKPQRSTPRPRPAPS